MKRTVKVKYAKPRLIKAEREFSLSQLGIFVFVFSLIGGVVLLKSFAAPANKPGSNLPPPPPLSVTQDWSNDPAHYLTKEGCFGVDSQATFNGSGTLAPGASYTINPDYTTCFDSESPIVAMHADWNGATTIRLETVYPVQDQSADGYPTRQIVAPVMQAGNSRLQTNLCEAVSGDKTVIKTTLGYDSVRWGLKITNIGNVAANVNVSGRESNGWTEFWYPGCLRADADNDQWNDALEYELLLKAGKPDGVPINSYAGSNYLLSIGTPSPDDEIDPNPIDFNDDNQVTQRDVDTISAHLGEGDGFQIDKNYPNAAWRRFDLDGDGYVTAHDISEVKALVGQTLPLNSDMLAPWAVIDTPDNIPAGWPAYILYAFASDNEFLTHVDFYLNGSLKCSTWGTGLTGGQEHQFRCALAQTPRKVGTAMTLMVIAYDNAGNAYSSSKTITTVQSQ